MARRIATVVTCGVLGFVLAGTALAEGSWTSYIQNAWTGFESRIWTDRNSDNVATVITFRYCTWAGPGTPVNNVTVNLRRVISWYPDENKGDKNLYCSTSGSGNWGDVNAGDYRFKIVRINGQSSTANPLNVREVRVTY
jgi:hypothetical protein